MSPSPCPCSSLITDMGSSGCIDDDDDDDDEDDDDDDDDDDDGA